MIICSIKKNMLSSFRRNYLTKLYHLSYKNINQHRFANFSSQIGAEEALSTDDYEDSDLEDALKDQFARINNLGLNSSKHDVDSDILDSIFDDETSNSKIIKDINSKQNLIKTSNKISNLDEENIYDEEFSISKNKEYKHIISSYNINQNNSIKNNSTSKGINTLKLTSDNQDDYEGIFSPLSSKIIQNKNETNVKIKSDENIIDKNASPQLFSSKLLKSKMNISEDNQSVEDNVQNFDKEVNKDSNFSTDHFFAIPKKSQPKIEIKESSNENENEAETESFEYSFPTLIMNIKDSIKEPKQELIKQAMDDYLDNFNAGYTLMLLAKYISRFMITNPENGKIYIEKLYNHIDKNWESIIKKFDDEENSKTQINQEEILKDDGRLMNLTPSKKLTCLLAYYKILLLNRIKKNSNKKQIESIYKQLHQQLLICLNAYKDDGLSQDEKANAINKVIGSFKFSEIIDRELCKEILSFAKHYADYLDRDDLLNTLRYARGFSTSHINEVKELQSIFRAKIAEIESSKNIDKEKEFLLKVKNFREFKENELNKDNLIRELLSIFNDFRNKLKKTQEDYKFMAKLVEDQFEYCISHELLLTEIGFLIPMITNGYRPKDEDGAFLLNQLNEKEERICELLKLDEIKNFEESKADIELKKMFSKIND